ncbi:hypothetical protein [Dactylosporangium sp. NPDC051541]|uniref:HD domain-containing protein n=1 Tax=Dactylosporangium sp. NPDC051541 TaxID=3363977 RepID=UPI0037B5A451
MTSRHALVIGIPAGPRDSLPEPIPEDVVRADVSAVCRALHRSGYTITVLGTRPAGDVPVTYLEEPATRNRCLDAIEAAAEAAPAGGTLLVYFRGHVTRIDGADYLVPLDVARIAPDRLIPVDLDVAGTVCFADPRPDHTLSRALARGLRPTSSPRTLRELLPAVPPEIVWSSNGEPDPVLCEGMPPLDYWPGGAATTALWSLTDGDDLILAGLRTAVRDQVAAAARTVRAGRAALAERTGLADRWSDDEYPLRILDALYRLLERTRLLPGEVADLVTAPFRREAALALALDGVEADPARLPRRAARLTATERDDLAMWLAYRDLFDRDDRWEDNTLLRVAGVLAADPRRMSAVLADHIGGPDPIDLAALHETLAAAAWHRGGDALVLEADCDHPAVHAALEDVLAAAGAAGVPARLDATAPGEPRPRFEVAGAGVRELLTGPGLYGDPAIAIRELYRRAAHRPDSGDGPIVFRQGVDERGREYVECEDTRAAWTEAAILAAFTTVTGGSGIGALTWFTVADEVLVWTADGVHARIPGHGGLFRIRHDPDVRTGGTLVRLLLAADVAVDVLAVLAEHLVVAEHEVEVYRAGARVGRWEPGVPQHPRLRQRARAGADQVWWIDGDSMLLADGLLVERPAGRYGWIANLTGAHRPRLGPAGDRLIGYDEAWVAAAVAASIATLAGWDGFTHRWLWTLTAADPRLAQLVYEWHRSERLPVDASAAPGPAPLGALGCLVQDAALVLPAERRPATFLDGWRSAVWRQATAAPAPAEAAGFPVPEPLDGYVLHLIDSAHAQVAAGEGAFVAPAVRTSDVRYRARRFVLAGLDLAPARPVGSGDPIATLLALGWPAEPGPASVRLLVVAARLGITLRVAATWFGSGPEQGFVPDRYDVALFAAAPGHTAAPWNPAVSHRRLQWAHDNWPLTADELRFRADRLRGAGYPVAFWTAADAPEAADPVTAFVRHLTDTPAPHRLADLAQELGATLEETHHLVAEAAARLNAPSPAPLRTPADRAHPAEILLAAAAQGLSVQQAAAGRALLQPIPAVAGALHPAPDVVAALVQEHGDHGDWRPLAPHALARLAERAGRSLEQQLTALAPYRHLGAPIPAIDPASAGYRPDRYDAALIEAAVAGPDDWTVDALRLLLAAGRYGLPIRAAHARLARFRSYGLTLDVDAATCPDGIVYWPDPIVLTEFYDGAAPAIRGPVDANAIRAAAASVREKPAETRERLLRYAPMFNLEVAD